MTKRIIVIGALDTKGEEFTFVKSAIERRGHEAVVLNTGVVGTAFFKPDITAKEIAKAAGTTLEALREKGDRGEAIAAMADGAAVIVGDMHAIGLVDGVFGMGGSAGTIISSTAMRSLPVGVPKLIVSTLAAQDTGPYVGTKDVVMFPAVVDVAGVNSISSRIYANAVGAIVGMVETRPPIIAEKPLIAASMFGNTTELVDQCRKIMEGFGYEVLVFHTIGTGGKTMESLIGEGYFTGALDVTTTELADEVVGGVLSAGPDRLDGAAATGLPQVIAPGCVDMVNFWARDTVPAKYEDRLFYEWNPNVTLMRTTPDENKNIGRLLAQKANRSSGPVAFFLPLRGVSILDSPDGEFWWPDANEALFSSIKENVRDDIPVYELDNNINDQAFATAVTSMLLEFLRD